MSKKGLIITSFLLCFSLVGCGANNNLDKQTGEVSFKDTKKIDVELDKNAPYFTELKPIKIEDKKMIEDILSMISQGKPLTDNSKIEKIRSNASKENKLILTDKSGTKREIDFCYDDLYNIGYLQIEGKKLDIDYSFFRYMKNLNEYRNIDTNIDAETKQLFKKYNWTLDYKINSLEEELPSNLKHKASEYPYKIYWAYNNELSKNIGLDYSKYLGKKVKVEIYELREAMPDYMKPRMDARGIVLKYNDKIIGAYIDAGRHSSFACSLDRKSLKDITNKEWDEWIKGYIDYEDELETAIAKMKPEEVIKEYYKALNSHDENMTTACLSRRYTSEYLAGNMDNNFLYNKNEKIVYDNIKSIKLIKIEPSNLPIGKQGEIQFWVTYDVDYNEPVVEDDGRTNRIITLKKEYDNGGWKISDIGMG